jgi:superfamily II DNA or RNA helicase
MPITEKLKSKIDNTPQEYIKKVKIDKDEQAGILADYIRSKVYAKLSDLQDEEKAEEKIYQEANQILELIDNDSKIIPEDKNVLRSISSSTEHYSIFPESSLVEPTLFCANNNKIPNLSEEFKKEIASSDKLLLLVSFIKTGGISILIETLKNFTENGGKLRVITTTYMGATDAKAIKQLSKLPNTQIKISYDTKATRLHAKAYMFVRKTGFSTAYIGSSNLSKSAITSGKEWNVKITAKGLPDLYRQTTSQFEVLWNSPNFETYNDDDDYKKLLSCLKSENAPTETFQLDYFFNVQPYPYQQKILDDIEYQRTVKNNYRNLVVMATGTGKTVISALDYARFRKEQLSNGRTARLLFIAHNVDILSQSLKCFRSVLRDQNFGGLWDGNNDPSEKNYVFATVQTFSNEISKFDTKYYDYIVVDEVHHSGASSYYDLLTRLAPKIVLGLTATPERMDNFDILKFFNGAVSAELDLFEAINEEHLCPFHYFGISDVVDLDDVEFRQGDYVTSQLSKKMQTDIRTKCIKNAIDRYCLDLSQIKGIGFCVDKDHAQFMASEFNRIGIKSDYLISGDRNLEKRNSLPKRLDSGEIQFIFTVNMYNEGVDIPSINTVLFLRPTKSKTIFLQQLGRGLRKEEDKECLTVLDFVGNQNQKYRFENKLKCLVTKGTVKKAVENGFSYVPSGCVVQLEKVAREKILKNINQHSTGRKWFYDEVREFSDNYEKEPTLENVTSELELTAEEIYGEVLKKDKTLTSLRNENFKDQNESLYRKMLTNVSKMNSQILLDIVNEILENQSINIANMTDEFLRLLYFTWGGKKIEDIEVVKLELSSLLSSRELLEELKELIEYNYRHVQIESDLFAVDNLILNRYAQYTRGQIKGMLGYGGINQLEGVFSPKDTNITILYVTLDRTERDFSPLTMYDDYIIDQDFFHWQSQPRDRIGGSNYSKYTDDNRNILLFARRNKKTIHYTFLGRAKLESIKDEAPFNIVWKLDKPLKQRTIDCLGGLVA